MNNDYFDLTSPLDGVKLTGSPTPFELTDVVKKRFESASNDPMTWFKGRTLQSTVIHMSQINFEREKSGIAGAAALVTPGILAAGRIFVSPSERKGIMAADPKFAETPYIAAVETITAAVYSPSGNAPLGREATLDEKKNAAALMLLGIQYLEAKAPGADKLLPMLVEFLQNTGYRLGNNIPLSLIQPSAPVQPQHIVREEPKV